MVGKLAHAALNRVSGCTFAAAVAWQAVSLAARPGFWRRTNREELLSQIRLAGIGSIPFTLVVAAAVGLTVVVQAQFWLQEFGQAHLLGPLLVAVVVREVGPLLANLVVIGRAGSAMATELGNMSASGEVRALDAQGVDPFVFLVVPRVIGAGLSMLALTVTFVVACLGSGYLFAVSLGVHTGSPLPFAATVLDASGPADFVNLFAKSLLPGLLTGTICSLEGLSVTEEISEVPEATTRALTRSVGALFVMSAGLSFVSYV